MKKQILDLTPSAKDIQLQLSYLELKAIRELYEAGEISEKNVELYYLLERGEQLPAEWPQNWS